jgi:peptidyl-prolyl cis-trans isomerase SurA
MKIRRIVLLFSALLLAGKNLEAETRTYEISVQVNGKPIVDSEVREAVRAQEHLIRMQMGDVKETEARILAVRASALFSLMERQLVLSEFEQRGGALSPQYVEDDIDNFVREKFGGDRVKFLRELAAAGMTLQGFREQRRQMMIVSHLSRQKLKDLPPPTPAQVEAWYRDHAEQFREKDFIKFSTITIPKHPVGEPGASPALQKKLAAEIRMQIVSGADFAQMAKTHSTDAYAKSGGERGLQDRADLSHDIAGVAFALKPGAVSDVMDVGTGFMIILCEAKQLGKQVPLETARPQIEKRLSGEMGRQAVNRWLSGLAAKAVIQPERVRNDFLKWLGAQQGPVEK